jgi:predicted ABC-type ATPase
MSTEQPRLIVLAGPNGAGKSTAAPVVLAEALRVQEFVNADVIARGLSAFHPERAAWQAGRIMLERLRDLAAQRVTFAFETTLAGRNHAAWMADLRRTGYLFHLVFVWLSSPELAISRVRERVRLGGHDVPEETIRRRYQAGLRNFFQLYWQLADQWRFYDNSNPAGLRLVATGCLDTATSIADAATWDLILKGWSSGGYEPEQG